MRNKAVSTALRADLKKNYETAAAELGMNGEAVRKVVSRLRAKFRDSLRRQIAARSGRGTRFHVFCAARRVERLEALAAEIGGTAVACDVTDPEDGEIDCTKVEIDYILKVPASLALDVSTVNGRIKRWGMPAPSNISNASRRTAVRCSRGLASGVGGWGGRTR